MTITIADADRSVSYSPSVSTAEFAVTFPIFDLADVQVLVDDVEVDPGDYTVAGTLVESTYSDATVTLDTPVSGVTVEIIGKRSPRRTSQFTEGQPLPTADFNLEINKLTAMVRELFDRLESA